jgi:hydrogenase expression/formation protein HypC
MNREHIGLPLVCTLNDQGCVVCSDAGIPVRVVSLVGDDALCEDAVGNQAQIAVELLAPVRVGDVLLVHGGVAIARAAASDESILAVRAAACQEKTA